MLLPSLLLWCLAVYGITFLLADAKILSFVREPLINRVKFFDGLLGCYFCTGFWVGIGLLVAFKPSLNLWLSNWQKMLLYVFAGAGTSMLLDKLLLVLESYVEFSRWQVLSTLPGQEPPPLPQEDPDLDIFHEFEEEDTQEF
jgi:hypothetical protein